MKRAHPTSSRQLLAVIALVISAWSTRAQATPPVSTVIVQHQVLPGERLQEIADRYTVTTQDIVRWNNLDPIRPMIVVGRSLQIHAIDPPPPRTKVSYRIRPGDSWSRIARVHNVDATHLRKRWNPKMGDVLRTGEHLTIWVEGQRSAAIGTSDPIDAAGGSQSIGKPTRGRIQGVAQIPIRPELYTVRTPNHSYGSTHAIALLQRAMTAFRASSGFTGDVTIGDMSQKHGGRFRPHRSHQSGRDIDIRLPLRAGLPSTTIPERADQVDWDITWKLVRAMLDTGQVVFVFLSSTRQKHLYEAAVRAGTTSEMLTELLQFPRRAATAIIRHSRGHTKHFHVRFTCAEGETRCRD